MTTITATNAIMSETDKMLDSILAKARQAGVLDSFKQKDENSPRDEIVLKLAALHTEAGGDVWDSVDAAEKRLDAAIARAEAEVSP